MFFRWLKCLVPCRHWFAESREGVLIQIYLCLIKALPLAERTGSKPNKRMMELLQWHQMGAMSGRRTGRVAGCGGGHQGPARGEKEILKSKQGEMRPGVGLFCR
jgi:hypothetical protein